MTENQESRSRSRIPTLLRGLAILVMVLMSSIWSGVAVHVGATYGLPRLVAASIALRGPVDRRDPSGRTPLYVASRDGRLKVVDVLLRHGADPDLALHIGVEKERLAIVSALLAGGADPNSLSESGASVLPIALYHSDSQAGAEIAHLLLRSGADLASRDYDSRYLLAIAARRSPLGLVRALLDLGADPNPPGRAPPLEIAVELERPDVVKLLLEAGANPNSDRGWSTLFDAARNQDLVSAELLLAFGADPNLDPSPKPLFEAIAKEQVAMVRLLLEHEADPDVIAFGAFTSLGMAISDENEDIVRLLLAAGADPNGSPEAGGPLLEDAITFGDPAMLVPIVALLLDAGASVGKDVLDEATSTILHEEMSPAEQEQFAAVTRLLFGRGAIETYTAHTSDDGTRVEWHFPEFYTNRLFQVWLYAESGRIPQAIGWFDAYFVQGTTSAHTARAHLVVGDLLGDNPSYQASLERAGIN